MADYDAIRRTIDANIYANGEQKITGEILNDVLNEMVDVQEEFNGEIDNLVENYPNITINGDVTNAPDEEDITSDANNRLKFANRPATNGMGYVILRKNKTFAEQVTVPNTIYEIRYDFDLGGGEINLPSNVELHFCGGSVYNGTLVGTLRNKVFDLSNFGVTYNDSSAGRTNAQRLKIIQGLTSPIVLEVSGEVWLSAFTITLSTTSFTIKGKGTAIVNVVMFGGFVAERITIENVKFISSGGNTRLFTIPSFQGAASFVAKGCSFSGDMRVATSYHDATDERYYFDEVTIEDCNIENVWCSTGANVAFNFSDAIIKTITIKHNRVHNFSTEIFNFGVTNESAFEPYVFSSDRVCYCQDNIVYNDIDWKPWADASITPPANYMCFLLLEGGICYYERNVCKHILSNADSVAVYDAYLSVRELYHNDNYWEDCGNLLGIYVEIWKSKINPEDGTSIRNYHNNRAILTDLSTTLGMTDARVTTGAKLTYFESLMDFVTMENNYIDVASLSVYTNEDMNAKFFAFNNNKINVGTFVSPGTRSNIAFVTPDAEIDWKIANNSINLVGQSNKEMSMAGSRHSTTSGTLSVEGNKLSGFTSVILNTTLTKNALFARIADNVILTGNNTSVSNDGIYGASERLDIRNNIIKVQSSGMGYVISNVSNVEDTELNIIPNSGSYYVLSSPVLFPDSTIFKALIKITDVESGDYSLSEINFNRVNSTKTVVAYAADKTLKNPITADDRIYHQGGLNISLFSYSSGFLISPSLTSGREYKIECHVKPISDITSFDYIPS